MTQALAQEQKAQSWKTRGHTCIKSQSGKTQGSNRQTWRGRKRTVASWGITGSELNRLSGAVRFMLLHCECHGGELWWVTTDNNTSRPLIHDVWKRITRLQGENGFPQYSVAVFEGSGAIHAHITFIGNRAIARRLKALPEGADIFQEFEEACQKLQGWA